VGEGTYLLSLKRKRVQPACSNCFEEEKSTCTGQIRRKLDGREQLLLQRGSGENQKSYRKNRFWKKEKGQGRGEEIFGKIGKKKPIGEKKKKGLHTERW